jgi:hypothetical protein
MGREEFYVYNGQVQKLPCSVRSYVFNDFNETQAEKVTAGVNSSFSEIWWLYPSANSDDIDRYVLQLPRTGLVLWHFGAVGMA